MKIDRRHFLKLLGIGTTTYVTIGTGLWKPPTEIIHIRRSRHLVVASHPQLSGVLYNDVYAALYNTHTTGNNDGTSPDDAWQTWDDISKNIKPGQRVNITSNGDLYDPVCFTD